MRYRLLLIGFLIAFSNHMSAQLSRQYDWYIEPGLRYGNIIPTVSSDSYLSDTHIYSFDLRFGVHSKGDRAWEQLYRCPKFGVGLRTEYYDAVIVHNDTTDRLMGDISFYGYLSGTIYQGLRFGFDYTIAGGLAYWPHHDSPETGTQSNKFISTALNCYLALDLGAWLYLTPYYDVYARIGISHSSNAALKLPNWGVNGWAGELGIRYHMFGRVGENYSESHRSTPLNRHSVHILDGFGLLQSKEDYNYYIGNTFQLGYSFVFHPKFRLGAGFDFMYNAENEACLTSYKNNNPGCTHTWNPMADGTNIATYGSIEVMYNRFVIQFAMAKYLYMGSVKDDFEFMPNSYKTFYERLGFKVYVGEKRRQFVGLAMKLHVGSIDYAEWTYGVHLFNW